MDVLTDLLARARAYGAVFAQTPITDGLGVEFGGQRQLAVHTILDGAAWFERAGTTPVRLTSGDVIFIPAGEPYRVLAAPGQAVRPHGSYNPPSDAPVAARLLCGAYTMDSVLSNAVLSALPLLVPIRGDAAGDQLRIVLAFLAEELAASEPGAQMVLDRSLDLMLALGLRAWFLQPDSILPGWYAALDDPFAGPAIHAIHAEPARAWSVAGLADLAGLSRSAFAKHFRDVVGQAPLSYLTNWRMTLAAQALADTPATIAAVAEQVGYSNEYAFANAFRRHFDEPPGRWRASHRARSGSPQAS